MRVLVTGGAGYIGSHATRLFLREGHDVVAYDDLSRGHVAAVPRDRLVVGDLADVDLLGRTFDERRIEAVVHFAALTDVGESVEDPARYYRNNFVNTLTLLDAMRHTNVSRIIFSSTAATYGTPREVPIPETHSQDPINPYGRSKLAMEWALADYAAAYGLGFASLRYFNAAGASPDGDIGEDHDPETHLIPIVLQAALGLRPHVSVFGTDYDTRDGTCVRDYVHVDDLATAHLLALQKLTPGARIAYNLGTGRGYSVREVINACERITGRTIPVVEDPRRVGDPAVLVALSDKAQRELGWRPKYDALEAIVETAWRWHSTRPRGYGPSAPAVAPSQLDGEAGERMPLRHVRNAV